MARALTEVVLEIGLPDGRLARLIAASPGARLVVQGVSQNGSRYPDRVLASLSGVAAPRPALVEALGSLLAEATVVHEEAGLVHAVGNLQPALKQALDGTVGEAWPLFGGDLVFRPILVSDGTVHVSATTTREAPVEEGVQRLAASLKARGLPLRLVRMEAYRPDHVALAAYDETLTPKQAEILRMALALGLYDTPRKCTLDTLAEIFGISKAAAHNRMKGAERKVLARYFS